MTEQRMGYEVQDINLNNGTYDAVPHVSVDTAYDDFGTTIELYKHEREFAPETFGPRGIKLVQTLDTYEDGECVEVEYLGTLDYEEVY